MKNNIGIGIIGTGFMGRTYAETTVKYNKGAKLVGVSGGSRAKSLAGDYEVAYEESPADLIGRDDMDAVIITTPESSHLEYTRMAADAGKHVLVEKPMAPSVKECDAMIKACDEASVILMVVQSQRFRRVHQQAKKSLTEGRIGTVRQVRIWSALSESFSIPVTKARPWYRDPDGGLYFGQCVHNFDMMHWIAGARPRRVFANIQSYGNHGIPNLSVMAQVEFENGVAGQLWVCLEMPEITFPNSQFHSQVVGDQGLLDFDGYSHLDIGKDGKWERVCEQPAFDILDPMDPVRLESYSDQNQAFIDSVREGKTPPVSGTDGKVAVELSLGALQSARTGEPFLLP